MNDRSSEFAKLWTSVLPQVSAFVGSLVFDANERDDVLQDTAVAAMQGFAQFDASKPFSPWAIGIARNQVRLYLRRKTKTPLPFDDEALSALVQAFSVKPSAEENRRLARLQSCIEKLDPQTRALCEYRYVHDLRPRHIAEKLKMKPNAVSKALQRIRESLRICIEKSPTPAHD